jgi:hypothetical protein
MRCNSCGEKASFKSTDPYFDEMPDLLDDGEELCSTVRKSGNIADFVWSKYGKKVNGCNGLDVTKLICSWQDRLPEFAYPFISRGTGGIIIAAAEIKKPITVLGCDALSAGEPDSTKYKRANGKKYPKTDRWHSFDEERKLVDRVSEEYGVDIEFR